MRDHYPALKDGFALDFLSKQTHDVHLPGSKDAPTETGIWSVSRSGFAGVQHLNQTIWLVYQNQESSTEFTFDCQDVNSALVAPFPAKTTVKNLFFPFEELVLETSAVKRGKSFNLAFCKNREHVCSCNAGISASLTFRHCSSCCTPDFSVSRVS